MPRHCTTFCSTGKSASRAVCGRVMSGSSFSVAHGDSPSAASSRFCSAGSGSGFGFGFGFGSRLRLGPCATILSWVRILVFYANLFACMYSYDAYINLSVLAPDHRTRDP